MNPLIILIGSLVAVFCFVAAGIGFRAAVRLWLELALAVAVTSLLLGWQPWL